MSCAMRRSSGTRNSTPCSECSRPDDAAVCASATSTTSPMARPRMSRPEMRTAARSPCISWRISAGVRTIVAPLGRARENPCAVGMALDATGDEREAPRHQQAAGAVLHHVAPRARARQRALEFAPRMAWDVQPRRELLARERRARGVQRAEDALRSQRRGSISAFAATRVLFAFSLTRQIPATKIAPPCRGGGIGRRTRFRS